MRLALFFALWYNIGMNERAAVEAVEKKYGSLEEFAIFCLEDGKSVLKSTVAIEKKSKATGLDPDVITFLLNQSPKFRGLMRSMLVHKKFTVQKELDHIDKVVDIATNAGRTVATAKGDVVRVDNTERGMIEAGRYLNELRETPIKGGESNIHAALTVNYIVPQPEVDDGKTITVDGAEVKRHSPLKAGALPPPAVRKRYDAPKQDASTAFGKDGIGADLDFTSSEAPGAEDIERSEPN